MTTLLYCRHILYAHKLEKKIIYEKKTEETVAKQSTFKWIYNNQALYSTCNTSNRNGSKYT